MTDKADKERRELEQIKSQMEHIQTEVDPPHTCEQYCPCDVIEAQTRITLAQINACLEEIDDLRAAKGKPPLYKKGTEL